MFEHSQGYMSWAKTHPRVRYEMTLSDVPHVTPEEFSCDRSSASLCVEGMYGKPELIEAIARRYDFCESGILPLCGSSMANFVALSTVLAAGDRVLMEKPVYDPIARVAEFLRLEIVDLPRRTDEAFVFDQQVIDDELARGVRAVVITNLHNPSGQYIDRSSMEALSRKCHECGTALIVDEVYLDAVALTSSQELWTSAKLSPNTVVTSSLTKIYGFGGLRAGWMLAGAEIIEQAKHVLDLLNVCNPAPSEALAVQAFAQMSQLEDRYRRIYGEGQRIFKEWVSGESLVSAYPNHGAVFELLKLPSGVDSGELNDLLVAKYDTQVTPGGFFGLADHIRMAVTLPAADQAEALARVSEAIRELRRT